MELTLSHGHMPVHTLPLLHLLSERTGGMLQQECPTCLQSPMETPPAAGQVEQLPEHSLHDT